MLAPLPTWSSNSHLSWCLEHEYLTEKRRTIVILSIGIDVAKKKLDVCDGTKGFTIDNNDRTIREAFKGYSQDSRIIMEATGKYHRLPHDVLHELGFKVMVINPYQSRHFAKAMNIVCKTDSVDAKVLSLFGKSVEFEQSEPERKNQAQMRDLSRHLEDLKQMKTELDLRHREADGFILLSLREVMDSLLNQIEKTESQLKEISSSDDQISRTKRLLTTIPGIGETTAIMLCSFLKELGQVSSKEIGALTGLAPMNNDSGTFKGKRRIRGGRHEIRRALYMPVLGAATRHNPRLKAFYNRMIDNGKPKKVALIACARKLIVWANAMVRKNQTWQEVIA
jgi:transposase